MVILNNKTSNVLGPYNGQTIAANASLTVNGSIVAWLSDGTLLADVVANSVSVTFAGNEVSGANAAQVLLQLGQLVDTDTDGAPYARTKVVPTGMTFCFRSFEFVTSTLSSLVNNDQNNAPLSDINISFYDINNAQLTSDLSTCVKTVVDFEPTYDFYVIGGQIRLESTPNQDVRVHVIAVPDVPANLGGSKIMVQNVNLRYISSSDKIEANGRAGKPLSYNATYHTNKIRFIVYHPAGYAQGLMAALELFK